jgi:hypothetical protein
MILQRMKQAVTKKVMEWNAEDCFLQIKLNSKVLISTDDAVKKTIFLS